MAFTTNGAVVYSAIGVSHITTLNWVFAELPDLRYGPVTVPSER